MCQSCVGQQERFHLVSSFYVRLFFNILLIIKNQASYRAWNCRCWLGKFMMKQKISILVCSFSVHVLFAVSKRADFSTPHPHTSRHTGDEGSHISSTHQYREPPVAPLSDDELCVDVDDDVFTDQKPSVPTPHQPAESGSKRAPTHNSTNVPKKGEPGYSKKVCHRARLGRMF